MDRTDSEIILLLQQNARISMSEISSRVNLSVSAVSERLKKLESSGYISKYIAILDPAGFGKTLFLFLTMEIRSLKDLAEVESFIQNEPDILEYHKLAGSSRALLKIVTENVLSLQRITDGLKQFDSIGYMKAEMISSSPKTNASIQPVL